MRAITVIPVLVSICLCIGGCSDLGYYAQAIDGHLTLMGEREPVDRLLAATDTPAPLRAQLQLSRELLDFAHNALALPDNGSYQSFIQTQRPYVVWNVFAAPELSLQPLQWCVPLVVGCTSYRGWFAPDSATAHADRLAEQGYDTFVGGVTAYSTLGWFSDPLLSTFFHPHQQWRTAALLFHELAHQQLYVANDTVFNESFASMVEREGTRRWLLQHGDLQQLQQAQRHWQQQDQRTALFAAARQALEAVYATANPAQVKRREKAAIISRLGTESHWRQNTSLPLNNATLTAFAAYTTLLPAFQRLLAEQRNSLPDFYRQAKVLAQQPPDERDWPGSAPAFAISGE